MARRLGISPPSVSYHKANLGYSMEDSCATRYDWAAIQRYYDEGHSVLECIERFGFSRWAWAYAVKRGAITPRPQTMPLGELLVATPRSRKNVKQRLVAAGLKRNECEHCGITRWRDRSLSLCLHHVNGNKHDNRLENLQLLCPNCHSQTPNFGSKNKRPLAA